MCYFLITEDCLLLLLTTIDIIGASSNRLFSELPRVRQDSLGFLGILAGFFAVSNGFMVPTGVINEPFGCSFRSLVP